MKYNEKYNRYVTKGGLVYRYDSKQNKLVLCKLTPSHNYQTVTCQKPKKSVVLVHRLVYETFEGEIPQGYEIDHIDGNKQNNDLSNLRCVSHADNMANPVTKVRQRVPKSEFGIKFYEHFGKTQRDDVKLYDKEFHWYLKHNKTCRWEKEV